MAVWRVFVYLDLVSNVNLFYRKSLKLNAIYCSAKREAKWNPGETAAQQKEHYDVSTTAFLSRLSLMSSRLPET
jgi:hypothetical protein